MATEIIYFDKEKANLKKGVGSVGKKEIEAALQLNLQQKNFTYVVIYYSNDFRTQYKNYNVPFRSPFVVMTGKSKEALLFVHELLLKFVSKEDIKNIDIKLYPKNYITDAKVLVARGLYYPQQKDNYDLYSDMLSIFINKETFEVSPEFDKTEKLKNLTNL